MSQNNKNKSLAGREAVLAVAIHGLLGTPTSWAADNPSYLPEVLVTGHAPDYAVPTVSTATKTDTPLLDLPLSIQAVSQQVMEDQQAIRLEDALKNVSGVQRDFGYGALYDFFIIRGFPSTSSYHRNGVRTLPQSVETANLERLEVLKGPASVLYGRIEPGGFVNATTKQPQDKPSYALQQQFGSFDLYRTTLDATGPVTADRSLRYRFDLAYLSSGSFRDFVDEERIFVAPALTWQASEHTEIGLDLEYRSGSLVNEFGIPAVGNRPASVPISRFLGEPGDGLDNEHLLLEAFWSHRFSDAWTLRNRFVWNREINDANMMPPLALLGDRELLRQLWQLHHENQIHSVNLDLTGAFRTFGLDHGVLFGADFFERDDETEGFANGFQPFGVPIDIFQPRYGRVDSSTKAGENDLFHRKGNQWYGVYAQDQIEIGDKLHVLAGGRYDWAGYYDAFSPQSFAELDIDRQWDDRFSPRVGVSYRPWPWLALYGNYTESLGMANGRSAENKPLPPETAVQHEVGLKTEFWDGRLTSSLAFFEVKKRNVLAPDVTTLDPFDSVAIGEAESRGIELDVTGQITDTLSLIGAYAYTETEITQDPSGLEGNRLPNAPLHSGSLWAKYAATEALDVGLGAFAASQRQGDKENSFQLPGYVRLDAMAAYTWRVGDARLTARLNVNNLLDKRYFKTSGGNLEAGDPRLVILPGEPLTLVGSLQLAY